MLYQTKLKTITK